MNKISKTVYGIVDGLTGNVWSRNRWASPTAVPDLFQTKESAEKQATTGKCGRLAKYAPEWNKIHKENNCYQPCVVEFELTEK